jgi:hypothetical protein
MLEKKEKTYNCEYINRNIPIYRFLEMIGYFPVRKRGKIYVYHSPFRLDKDPSFNLDIVGNVYHDFGDTERTSENRNYSLIDLLMKIYNISVKEALNMALSFSFSPYQPSFEEREAKMEITEVKELSHPVLINYLREERHVDIAIAKKYCVEVHYTNKGRSFFAIGFHSDSGGYELRNKLDKRTIGIKDVTYINEKNEFECICVYEGFITFLSSFFSPFTCPNSAYLILNGVGMTKRVKEILVQFREVQNYCDNDSGGDIATGILGNMGLSRCIDMRDEFKSHNDINDYVVFEYKKAQEILNEKNQSHQEIIISEQRKSSGMNL